MFRQQNFWRAYRQNQSDSFKPLGVGRILECCDCAVRPAWRHVGEHYPRLKLLDEESANARSREPPL